MHAGSMHLACMALEQHMALHSDLVMQIGRLSTGGTICVFGHAPQ